MAKMSGTEKIKIWQEIKERSISSFLYKTHCITSVLFPLINRSGLNPIEILLWSRGKELAEVQERLKRIKEELIRKKEEKENI